MEVGSMDIKEMVDLYNVKGITLEAIGKETGKSKSSVQRLFAKHGYVYNKSIGKYEANVSRETIENKNSETNINDETNVSRETINNKTNVSRETMEEMVNRTYAISSKIDKAIRIKSAIEGKKPIDIVREALKAYIEQKYFDM
jgi:predicted DNA-binding protein YlxM (UPF0122 family)